MRERAVALILVATVLTRRPEEEDDPDDDAEERHDGAEDQDLCHGTIIVPSAGAGKRGSPPPGPQGSGG